MSFRFSLGRAQVKHFKTALTTLNKIGGELLVEAIPEQVRNCIGTIDPSNRI